MAAGVEQAAERRLDAQHFEIVAPFRNGKRSVALLCIACTKTHNREPKAASPNEANFRAKCKKTNNFLAGEQSRFRACHAAHRNAQQKVPLRSEAGRKGPDPRPSTTVI